MFALVVVVEYSPVRGSPEVVGYGAGPEEMAVSLDVGLEIEKDGYSSPLGKALVVEKSPVRGALGVLTGPVDEGIAPDAAVPLIPPVPPSVPEAAKPELYAVPFVPLTTAMDVLLGRLVIEPEAWYPDAPPVPPSPPEIM